MDLQTSKIELAKLIFNIENQQVISKMIDFIKSKEKDFWFDLTASQQQEVQNAINELDQGNRIKWNEVRDKVA